MKKFFAIFLCCCLLLGGCGTKKNPYVPTGNGLAVDESTEPTGSAITEQTMSLAYYPDRSLNPYTCTDLTNRVLFGLLYQSLFAVDEDYQPMPVLCSGYQVSRDMKTYTFSLAQASFSDGVTITASDVAASLLAAKDSPYYSGRFGYLESVTAQGEDVVVQLTTPYENFPVLLDVPIVKASQVSADRPLGTGPYFYETIAGMLRLRRRTDWWCVANLPVTAQKISLVQAESAAQLRDQFEFSGLGLVCTDPGSESYVDFHSDYELWDSENGIFLYLACNSRSQVLQNDGIRAALTYAIDRTSLVDKYYRGFAYGAVLAASPESPNYSAVLAAQYDYNPYKLTTAVAEAALESNALVLLVNTDDGLRLRVARSIAESLNACGLKVTMSELDGEKYRAALEAGEFDLYLGQTKLSANMDLSAFFAPEGVLSYGGLSDPALYALCKEALANRGNYYTLQKTIFDDGLLCPILFRSNAIFVQRGTFADLFPARDNVFYYDLGKNSEDIRSEEG
ncbi:MAG: ABC transporter substrate-binding protein [Oscillospiraceae bacterium]|nr:ABC transporter substrate-binding protein [Oscillospiraceae bacterium]